MLANKIKLLYNKQVKSKFFFKFFLLYATIITSAICIMMMIVAYNITSTLKTQAINYNKQVIKTVSNFFYLQNDSLKKSVSNLYIINPETEKPVLSNIDLLFAYKDEQNLLDNISNTRIVNNHLTNFSLSNDENMKSIMCISTDFEQYLYAHRIIAGMDPVDYFPEIKEYLQSQNANNINLRKTYFIPAFNNPKNNSSYFYCIYDYIRKMESPNEYIGFFAATYSTDSLYKAYSQFSEYLIGEIFIITSENEILYDSSGDYDNKYSELLRTYVSEKTGTYSNKNYLINIEKNNEYGFVAVGLMANEEIYGSAIKTNRFFIFIAIICIIIILLLTFLSTKEISNRVEKINNTLKIIQNGNLSARVPILGKYDEIEQISINLNLMSEKLGEHINNEYVEQIKRTNAELKQKSAELYALQSQINPHFLYNTLEAIRMHSLTCGDVKVANMTKILAKMFRRSIKGGYFVSIEDELDECYSYLELYNIRYNDKLEVIYDVDDSIKQYAIIKHLLQPIIENYIIHGFKAGIEDNVVKISIHSYEKSLLISVSDNGRGIDEEELKEITNELKNYDLERDIGNRIGLSNVNARIKMIYGKDYGLEIKSKKNVGTEVTLSIPIMTKEELQKYVQSFSGR